jgi:hypothetical protein
VLFFRPNLEADHLVLQLNRGRLTARRKTMRKSLAVLLLIVVVVTLPACGARRLAFRATATAVAATAAANVQAPSTGAAAVMNAPIVAGAVLFQDDFQDGQADGWNISAGWMVQQDGDRYVLSAAVPGSAAVPQGGSWTDYAFQVSTRIVAGGLGLSYRVSQVGRYALHIRPEGMYLIKEQPRGTYLQLTQTAAPSFGGWHTVVMAGSGGQLQVFVDGVLQLAYTDPAPLPSGTIGLTTLDGYSAEVDDILVTALAGPLPAAAALPPTVPAVEVELPLGELPAPEDIVSGEEEITPEPMETEAAVNLQPSEEEEVPPSEGELVLPVIDYFNYEPAADAGCYYLAWDLHDAEAAYLDGEGVVAPGSTEVCHTEPGAHVHTLRAENAAGGIEQAVTIVVGAAEEEGAADLTGEASVYVPAPTQPRTVSVAIEVHNEGQGGAGAFTVRWYPHQASDEVGCSIDVAGLPAQSSVALNPCSYTYASRGEMHWRLVVDAENDIVGEADEGNNEATGIISVDQGQAQGGDPSVPPVSPSGLQVGGWSANTTTLVWIDNSDNEDGFLVRHVGVALEAETGPNVTQAEISTPPCGERHEYRVRAFNAAGDSEPSETLVIEYECQ